MAVRRIVLHPNPILKEVSKPIRRFDERLHKLLDDMAETMYDARGVGLAAPQVGILKRVFVVDIGTGLYEIINPEIVEQSGSQAEPPEGCLSIPHLSGLVKRAFKVKVKGQDRYGKEVEFNAKEYLSRAFQHEIDHLNGILFIERANKVFVKGNED